jgi:hypothetical protein
VADLLTARDGKTHTFDWLYHNRGPGIASSSAMEEAPAPEGQGFEYLKSVRRGKTSGSIHARVDMGASQVGILVNGGADSDVIVGTGVGESVLDRVPLLVVSRRGDGARFAATIELASKGQAGEVESVEIQPQETSGYLIRVLLRNNHEELYAYDPAGARRTVEGLETDSKLLCLRRHEQQPFQPKPERGDLVMGDALR